MTRTGVFIQNLRINLITWLHCAWSRDGAVAISRNNLNRHFDALPSAVQKLAREKYALWNRDPYHPSLRFEERRNGICIVRIGDHYRALGLREGDVIAWFWIGTHEEYNRFRF